MSENTAVIKAIGIAGGEGAFMKALGIKQRTLYYMKAGRRLSVKRVLDIEKLFGVPRHEINPEVWPAPAKRSRGAA
jgi:DNA-binding transcriptional regulator YdaS (Cro superfamily)